MRTAIVTLMILAIAGSAIAADLGATRDQKIGSTIQYDNPDGHRDRVGMTEQNLDGRSDTPQAQLLQQPMCSFPKRKALTLMKKILGMLGANSIVFSSESP